MEVWTGWVEVLEYAVSGGVTVAKRLPDENQLL
jgi:hypothetical protein